MDVAVTEGPPPPRGEPHYRAEFAGGALKHQVIADAIASLAAVEPLGAPESFRLRLCLDEAIQNAISHGNASDPLKLVRLLVFRVPEGWEIRIADEGRGFDPGRVPDPRTPDGLEKESGRGILILKEYMHGVRYYDGGRTLVLSLLSPQRVE
jgi:serine/threonine-protein kinase RsbW